MPTGRTAFKHNDTRRLIRAAKAEGCRVTGLEHDLKAGKITVLIDDAGSSATHTLNNPLDRVLRDAQDQDGAS